MKLKQNSFCELKNKAKSTSLLIPCWYPTTFLALSTVNILELPVLLFVPLQWVCVCVSVCVWLLMCVCVSVWVMDAFICEQDFWLCQKGSKWIFRLYYSMASKLLLARVCFSTLPRLPRQLRWSILDFQILRQDIVMAYQSFICRMLWICICLWLAT